MTNNKIVPLTGISLLVLIITFALIWVFAYRERPIAAHYGLLIDYSDSRTINCNALETTLNEILTSENLMSDSNLYFYSTGDDSSSDEPVLLGKYPIPVNIKVLEGKSEAENKVQNFISNVKTRCEKEPLKKRSPIVLGIMRTIENLKTNGCNPQANCKIFIQTDGKELSEKSIKKELINKIKNNSKPQISILNQGIHIEVCGFAQVVESKSQKNRHSVRTANKTFSVWKKIFTDTSLVSIQPHCY